MADHCKVNGLQLNGGPQLILLPGSHPNVVLMIMRTFEHLSRLLADRRIRRRRFNTTCAHKRPGISMSCHMFHGVGAHQALGDILEVEGSKSGGDLHMLASHM